MKSPESFNDPIANVESQANYEGNATLLLVDRLNNSRIKDQITDLLYQGNQAWIENLKNNTEPLIEDEHLSEDFVKEKDTGMLIQKSELSKLPESREEIEGDLDKRIAEISSVTPIRYSSQQPSEEAMSLNFAFPDGKKFNTQQMSLVEAHEKGHTVRLYFGDFFRRYFSKGFDLEQIGYSEKDHEFAEFLQEQHESLPPEERRTFEESRQDFFNYLFSGPEVAERMSQLKNYFGMKGDEEFTKEHLAYAREHYVKDTGLDNYMTYFLKAVTPETEDAFIELVNTSGI